MVINELVLFLCSEADSKVNSKAYNNMPPIPKQSDFTRTIWSNNSAGWQARITHASNDWLEFEQLLVREGKRAAFITQVSPADLISFSQKWHSYGCSAIPLGMVGISNSYTSNAPPVVGSKFHYRVLVYKANRVVRLAYDDVFIGKILGYPECCIRFFEHWWNQEKHIDTTWQMFKNSKELRQECNILLRYLGIRPVFHLPCAFDCIPTIELATQNLKYFEQYFPESYETLIEVTQWPVEWSAVNGIAEVKFPLGKISARTDLYKDSEKHIVRYEGTAYPIDGENGTVFPYTRKKELLGRVNMRIVKNTVKKVATTMNPAKVLAPHIINGFTDANEQLKSHEWLINQFNKHFHNIKLEEHTFIDLGAGNGDLVRLIGRLYPNMSGIGVDNNYEGDDVIKYDIKDFHKIGNKYDIALIAEQRFADTYKNLLGPAIDHIFTFANNIFIYNYTTRKAWMIEGTKK
jgi:hypothetical protein